MAYVLGILLLGLVYLATRKDTGEAGPVKSSQGLWGWDALFSHMAPTSGGNVNLNPAPSIPGISSYTPPGPGISQYMNPLNLPAGFVLPPGSGNVSSIGFGLDSGGYLTPPTLGYIRGFKEPMAQTVTKRLPPEPPFLTGAHPDFKM